MNTYHCLPNDPITQGSYSLTTVQPEHIESIRLWRNVQMEVLRQKSMITEEQQQRYFAQHIWPTLDQERPCTLLLAFRHQETLIGYGGLVHIAWEDKRAEVSFLLDPAHTRDIQHYDSYFSTFLTLIKEVAFRELKLNRLFTETYAFRDAHIQILERNGFYPEGCLRENVWIDDRPIDSLMHGCLNDEK